MLRDVNHSDLRGAAELALKTMSSVINPEDGVPYFAAMAWPTAEMAFSRYHSESHVPGRHLNAMFRAKRAGLAIPQETVEQDAAAARFSFSGAVPLPLNRADPRARKPAAHTGTCGGGGAGDRLRSAAAGTRPALRRRIPARPASGGPGPGHGKPERPLYVFPGSGAGVSGRSAARPAGAGTGASEKARAAPGQRAGRAKTVFHSCQNCFIIGSIPERRAASPLHD